MEHTLEEVTLQNGAQGLIVDVPGVSTVNFWLGFYAGSLLASESQEELAHVMEHTIYGADSIHENNLATELDYEQNGADNNAFTGTNIIGYEAECASFEGPRILRLLCTSVSTPQFKTDEVESEIGNVREELQDFVSDHARIGMSRLQQVLHDRRSDEEGLVSLPNITRKALKEHHKSTHTTDNLRFIIAGDTKDKSDYLDQLETLPLPQKTDRTISGEPSHILDEPLVLQRDIPQIYYCLQFAVNPLDQREHIAACLLKIFLTDRFGSWIFSEARQRGLAYGVHSYTENCRDFSELSIFSFVSPENAEGLFEIIARSVRWAHTETIDETELSAAKRVLRGQWVLRHKTPGRLADWYMEELIPGRQPVEFAAELEQLETISAREIQDVATKLFKDYIGFGMSFVGDVTPEFARKLQDYFS